MYLSSLHAWHTSRRFAAALCLATLIGGCTALGGEWSSEEIRARVVTPEGKPVSGAIVLATWEVTGWYNGANLGKLAVEETETNNNGEFRLPAWGPRSVKSGVIMETEPQIRIFHPDFVPLFVLNDSFDMQYGAAPKLMKFRHQDKNLILQPFQGPLPEYEDVLMQLNSSLGFIVMDPVVSLGDRCYWTKAPKILWAIEKIRRKLTQVGKGLTLRPLKSYVLTENLNCGDPTKFFPEY
jgi:hypothetical protein